LQDEKRKEVRKFLKKYQGNFGIRITNVKMKKGKKWMRTTTYPQLLVVG